MHPDEIKASLDRIEKSWPNHADIIQVWFSKCKVVLLVSHDIEKSMIVKTRLPEPYYSADVMSLRAWFDSTDSVKERYVGKVIFLTHQVADGPMGLPIGLATGLDAFIWQSKETGIFSDLLDKTAIGWGDASSNLGNYAVLNGIASKENPNG